MAAVGVVTLVAARGTDLEEAFGRPGKGSERGEKGNKIKNSPVIRL